MEASKVTSGNVAVKPDALVLMELLRQAAAEYEAPFEAVGLHLTLRAIGGSAERTIYSDGQLIWRVLQNLLVFSFYFIVLFLKTKEKFLRDCAIIK